MIQQLKIPEGFSCSPESSFEQRCSIIEIQDEEVQDQPQSKSSSNWGNLERQVLKNDYQPIKDSGFASVFDKDYLQSAQQKQISKPKLSELVNYEQERSVQCSNENDYDRLLREVEESELNKLQQQYQQLQNNQFKHQLQKYVSEQQPSFFPQKIDEQSQYSYTNQQNQFYQRSNIEKSQNGMALNSVTQQFSSQPQHYSSQQNGDIYSRNQANLPYQFQENPQNFGSQQSGIMDASSGVNSLRSTDNNMTNLIPKQFYAQQFNQPNQLKNIVPSVTENNKQYLGQYYSQQTDNNQQIKGLVSQSKLFDNQKKFEQYPMKEINLYSYQDPSPLKRNNLNNSNNQFSNPSKNISEGPANTQNLLQIERSYSGHRNPQDNNSQPTKFAQFFLNGVFASPNGANQPPQQQSSSPSQFSQSALNPLPLTNILPLSQELSSSWNRSKQNLESCNSQQSLNNQDYLSNKFAPFKQQNQFNTYQQPAKQGNKVSALTDRPSPSSAFGNNRSVLEVERKKDEINMKLLHPSASFFVAKPQLVPDGQIVKTNVDSLTQQQQLPFEGHRCQRAITIDLVPFRSEPPQQLTERINEKKDIQQEKHPQFQYSSQQQQKGIFERNLEYLRLREQKLDQLREENLNEELKKLSFAPKINQNSSQMARQTSDLVAWKEAKQAKNAEKINQQVEEEEQRIQAMQNSKTISKGSQKILSKMEAGNTNQRVEDKLLANGQKYAQHKEQLDSIYNSNPAKHTPLINKNTFKLLINKKKKINQEQKLTPSQQLERYNNFQTTRESSKQMSNASSRASSKNNTGNQTSEKGSLNKHQNQGNKVSKAVEKLKTYQISADSRKNVNSSGMTQLQLQRNLENKNYNNSKIIQQLTDDKDGIFAQNILGRGTTLLTDQSRNPRFQQNDSLQKSLLIRQDYIQSTQVNSTKPRELSQNLKQTASRDNSIKNTSRDNITQKVQSGILQDNSCNSLKFNQQNAREQFLEQLTKQKKENGKNNNQQAYTEGDYKEDSYYQKLSNRNKEGTQQLQQYSQLSARNRTPPTPSQVSKTDFNSTNSCKLIIQSKTNAGSSSQAEISVKPKEFSSKQFIVNNRFM